MSSRLSLLSLLAILLTFAALAYTSLEQKSVTIDEYGYLPAAYNLVSTGDLRFSEWHTPLVNQLLGLPLIRAEVDPITPPTGTPPDGRFWFWNNGDWFADANRERYHALLVRARLASVALGLALGVLVYRWAREIAPPRAAGHAGLLAAALTLFHPEVLAHSRLATLDVGLTFFFSLSLYAFHRFLEAPGARRAILAGTALGLAQASKFTSLLLLPVMVVFLIARAMPAATRRGRFRKSLHGSLLGQCVLLGIAALVTLHSSYLFQDPITRADSFAPQSSRMKTWQEHWPGWLAAPIPVQYVRAFDRQLADQERRYQCYLLGDTIRGGRVDYFATLLVVKTPVAGVLLLVACTALYAWRRMPRRLPGAILLAPALLVVATFSLSNKQIGLRMVLPVIPLVAIWIAAASPVLASGRRWSVVATVAVGLFVASSLSVHPNYLSYFNLASGGTENGYRIGLGSNDDWGQDLPALAAWMKHRGIDHVELLYYGRIDPEIYAIDYTVPRRFAPGGVPLVVSASHYGLRYPVPDHGERRSLDIPARRDEIFDSGHWNSQRITPTLFVFERP
jgi:hypothetical protein